MLSPQILNMLSLAAVSMGMFVTLKGILNMSRGYSGAESIVAGLMMAVLGFAVPSLLPSMLSSTTDVFAADKSKSADKPEPEPTETPTADPTTDSTDTTVDGSTDSGSPLDPHAFEIALWVIAVLIGIAVLVGLVAGGVVYARSRKRKATEAREAAARAKAEEEARLDRVWAEAVERHDHVRDEMMRHATDIDLVLSMPAINDQHESKTAAFTEALAKAADLAHDTRPASAEAVEAYAAATRAAERAWGAAWRNADIVRLSKFSPEERATIKQVMKLMERAQHETTAEARAAYYRKALKDLGHLIVIPRQAAEAIEQRVAGVLANPSADPQVTTYNAPTNLDASILTTLARKARQKVTR